MKRFASLTLLITLMSSAAQAAGLMVQNNSGLPIDELFASAPGKTEWGANLLEGIGAGSLDSGKSHDVAALADGIYDLRISAPDEAVLCDQGWQDRTDSGHGQELQVMSTILSNHKQGSVKEVILELRFKANRQPGSSVILGNPIVLKQKRFATAHRDSFDKSFASPQSKSVCEAFRYLISGSY